MNFTTIFKKYDFLGEGLNYIIKNSNSNYAPYHNLNHNITVSLFSYYLGKSEKLNEIDFSELLIASLFHDFNHSAGKKNDSNNINEAKKGISEFLKEYPIENVSLGKINKILDATEFPYKIKNEDLNIQQKIIRDADLCQLFESNRLQSNFLGLQKEAGITLEEQIKRQEVFYKNLNFNTEMGKKLGERFKKEINEELNYLKEIIK